MGVAPGLHGVKGPLRASASHPTETRAGFGGDPKALRVLARAYARPLTAHEPARPTRSAWRWLRRSAHRRRRTQSSGAMHRSAWPGFEAGRDDARRQGYRISSMSSSDAPWQADIRCYGSTDLRADEVATDPLLRRPRGDPRRQLGRRLGQRRADRELPAWPLPGHDPDAGQVEGERLRGGRQRSSFVLAGY